MGIKIELNLPAESLKEIAKYVFEEGKSEGYFKKDEIKVAEDEENYLSIKQAVKKTGLGDRTIIRHIKNKLFVGNKVGKLWRVSEKSINEYINKNK